jgi:hypothetical protein
MEFRILGSIEIVGEDGPVSLHRGKEQALLAYFMLHPNTGHGLASLRRRGVGLRRDRCKGRGLGRVRQARPEDRSPER